MERRRNSRDDHKLREDVENIKNILYDLQSKVMDNSYIIKDNEMTSSDGSETSSIAAIKQEISNLRETVMGGHSQGYGGTDFPQENQSHKRAAAGPAGMTLEQAQEMKKQQLLVNSLQDKIKELETRVSLAHESILEKDQRISDLEMLEQETSEDIYLTIEKIENSISEKIAQQRFEVKKLAGDIPEPINYDPFNYGDALKGDSVDFEARQRIFELKLMIHVLRDSMQRLADKSSGGRKIDLGYKVVRMDQLLEAIGFDGKVHSGDESTDGVLLVNQTNTRRPDNVKYPKKEIFQEDSKANLDIMNSIMQTMYRLQSEFSDMQKQMMFAGSSSVVKTLDKIQSDLNNLKENKITEQEVKKLMKRVSNHEQGSGSRSCLKTVGSSRPAGTPIPSITNTNNFVCKDVFTKAVKNINESLKTLLKHFDTMDTSPNTSTYASTSKQKCCNTFLKDPAVNAHPYDAKLLNGVVGEKTGPSIPVFPKFPQYSNQDRLRYTNNREHAKHAYCWNEEFGLKYPLDSPRYTTSGLFTVPTMDLAKSAMSSYITGEDGKTYQGAMKENCCDFDKDCEHIMMVNKFPITAKSNSAPKKIAVSKPEKRKQKLH